MPSEKQKAPAYQWYPKDYDTDEAVKLMTYEEEGIYRRLLDHQWLHGGIPADVDKIARLVPKVPASRFKKLWASMSEKFAPQGDRLVNARLERGRGDSDEFHEEKRAGGIASAEARRQKYGTAQPPNSARTASEQASEHPVRSVRPEQPEPASASASASASAEHERARARGGEGSAPRVFEAFGRCWKAAYGHDCSLIPNHLEYMRLEQQLSAHGEAKLLAALTAYFATTDAYIRREKHPFSIFLRDPLKYLAGDAQQTGRPKGCRHEPSCADDAAHTSRRMAEGRRVE